MKLIFVRHGRDDPRYRGGWSSRDLVPEGEAQAARLARHLKENICVYGITKILPADLPRTMTTANIIASELDLPVCGEPRLREINNGDLAGMDNESAIEKFPGLFFSTLEMDTSYPNGESPEEFFARIKTWFREYTSDCRDGNVLVVTHGGVINVVYHLVKGLEWSNRGPVFRADNCSVHVLDLDAMEFETENRTDFL